MKSIDNLREYALTAASVNATTRAVLAGYIDEIEREAEELRDRDYRNGVEDGEMAAEREVKELTDERDLLKTQWEAGVDFDQRLAAAAEGRIDVTLFGVDYTALPVDADGVPIHVGDVMEWVDEPGITRTVTSIQLANDGWWVYISGTGRRPDKYLHHHAPTVEDVLREFADAWADWKDGAAMMNPVETFAAKLRMAGDGE